MQRYQQGNKNRASFHHNLWLVVLVLSLSLLAGIPTGMAQTVCVPPAPGVPPNYIPPHWWDNTPAQPVYYQSVYDPRWASSAAVAFSDGTVNTSMFRALHDDSNLYFSWHLLGSPAQTATQNTLYLGLQAGGQDVIYAISLATLATTADGLNSNPPQTSVAIVAKTINPDGTLPDTSLPTPSWMSNTTRVWINSDGTQADNLTPDSAPNTWAVQMQVPQKQIGINASKFKMWFQVIEGFPGSSIIPATAWPTAQQVTENVQFANVFPLSGNWGDFQLSSGPNDGSCPSAGVSLDVMQIGTTNTPSSYINYRADPPGPHPVNTLFARPKNTSGQAIPANGIKATFRIANWGSMPNWEDGVPKDVLWSKIQCGTDGSPNLTDCGTDVGNANQINNGATADATNDSHFDWALTNAQLAPFQSGERRVDNCMLVELTSNINGLVFLNNSVRRNMDFMKASNFSRDADISIKGLSPILNNGQPQPARDVYVWVETLNMPAVSSPSTQPTQIETTVATDRQIAAVAGVASPGSGKKVAIPDQNTLEQMASSGQITQVQMDKALPSYRVHVYYDTGKSLSVGGQQKRLLRPQGAFGYYVSHEGQLYGWQHDLVGKGFQLERVDPNIEDFYRIRQIPNDGQVTVTTKVTALATRPTCFNKGGSASAIWMLGGIFVIGLVLYGPRINRKESAGVKGNRHGI